MSEHISVKLRCDKEVDHHWEEIVNFIEAELHIHQPTNAQIFRFLLCVVSRYLNKAEHYTIGYTDLTAHCPMLRDLWKDAEAARKQ